MTEPPSEISSGLHLGCGEGGLGARIQSLAVSWSQVGENSGGSCSFLPTISSERTDTPALSSLLPCDGLVPELLLRPLHAGC